MIKLFGTCYMLKYVNSLLVSCPLGADHWFLGEDEGVLCFFFGKNRLFSKQWKVNSLLSFFWEKNSLFMKW